MRKKSLPEKLSKAEMLIHQLHAEFGHQIDQDTARRHAKFLADFYSASESLPEPRVFQMPTLDEVSDFEVNIGPIPFFSLCSHHLLPFFGSAEIQYSPVSKKVLGLSKFYRIVEFAASQPQTQEELTARIIDAIGNVSKPYYVRVTTTAQHLCVSMRGVKVADTQTSVRQARSFTPVAVREEQHGDGGTQDG